MLIVLAREAGFRTVVSHRSGETEDATIAHIVVGCNTDFIKTGSVSRGEGTAKYNELLSSEASLLITSPLLTATSGLLTEVD